MPIHLLQQDSIRMNPGSSPNRSNRWLLWMFIRNKDGKYNNTPKTRRPIISYRSTYIYLYDSLIYIYSSKNNKLVCISLYIYTVCMFCIIVLKTSNITILVSKTYSYNICYNHTMISYIWLLTILGNLSFGVTVTTTYPSPDDRQTASDSKTRLSLPQ